MIQPTTCPKCRCETEETLNGFSRCVSCFFHFYRSMGSGHEERRRAAMKRYKEFLT